MEQSSTPTQTTEKNDTRERVRVPVNWVYQFQQYGAAILVAGILFVAFSLYLYNRRGYYDLYIVNKIFAGDATVLLGIVLLLGPLSRYFKIFDRYVQYRKELGIVAYVLALAHTIASFFFLRSHFPLERFLTYGRWPFIFGLLAVIVLTYILVISNQAAMRKLGPKLWWFMQGWGVRAAFLFTVLHVGVMKYKDWLKWYQQGGGTELVHPEWPGAGILVGWFMAAVIVVRVGELFGQRAGKLLWYVCAVGLPIIYFLTFWRGYMLFNP